MAHSHEGEWCAKCVEHGVVEEVRRNAEPSGFLDSITCHCVPGRCDCTEARVHAAEMTATFGLRWKADMRAIKRWQAAGPDRELTWPDHADMVVWLLDQLEARSDGA